MFWQDLKSHDSPALAGQLYSSDLHQSERGQLLPEAMSARHFSMGVVPRQEHYTVSRASSKDAQCSSRYRIENREIAATGC